MRWLSWVWNNICNRKDFQSSIEPTVPVEYNQTLFYTILRYFGVKKILHNKRKSKPNLKNILISPLWSTNLIVPAIYLGYYIRLLQPQALFVLAVEYLCPAGLISLCWRTRCFRINKGLSWVIIIVSNSMSQAIKSLLYSNMFIFITVNINKQAFENMQWSLF